MDLNFSEQLLRVVFSTFCGQKKIKFFSKNIVASALKNNIKIFFDTWKKKYEF